jgi:hypothetical protein
MPIAKHFVRISPMTLMRVHSTPSRGIREAWYAKAALPESSPDLYTTIHPPFEVGTVFGRIWAIRWEYQDAYRASLESNVLLPGAHTFLAD